MIIDFIELTKPKITFMSLILVLCGIAFAPGVLPIKIITLNALAICLLVSGSSTLNMYLEKDFDALMTRTANRPLPAGRMHAYQSLVFGLSLSLAALLILWFFSNSLVFILGFISLLGYVGVYTPLKRISAWSLIIGAIPGAMPVLLGFVAKSGKIDLTASLLFGLAFLWQIPHFIAISIFRGKEYTKAGFPVVAEVIGESNAILLIVFSTLLLLFNSALFVILGISSDFYALSSSIIGLGFLWICINGFYVSDKKLWAKEVFKYSLVYQTSIYVLLVIDLIIKNYIS